MLYEKYSEFCGKQGIRRLHRDTAYLQTLLHYRITELRANDGTTNCRRVYPRPADDGQHSREGGTRLTLAEYYKGVDLAPKHVEPDCPLFELYKYSTKFTLDLLYPELNEGIDEAKDDIEWDFDTLMNKFRGTFRSGPLLNSPLFAKLDDTQPFCDRARRRIPVLIDQFRGYPNNEGDSYIEELSLILRQLDAFEN